MEIVYVPDILVYRGGSLHSLRGQQIVKGGELHTFGSGSGMVKDGKLYVLDEEDYVVRMVTGKRSVSIVAQVSKAMILDWGDGTTDNCWGGANSLTHEYTDNLSDHVILLKGSAEDLTELYCQSNELTMLEVMRCERLSILQCHSNLLTSLNICPNISYLTVADNNLTTLDVSNNEGLTELLCYNNQLTQLDVSSNVALRKLYCGANPLNTLSLSHTNVLDLLNCAETPQLDKVDLANSLPARNGLTAGGLYLSEIVAGVQDICTFKNWEVTIYT